MSRDWQQLAAAAGVKLVLPPPDAGDVARAERVVGSRLSASLADLYRHADGVVDQWGYAYVLPIAEMREQNETFRSSFGDLYMSFDDLVLFGQLGNGDMLFQPRVPGGNDNVFVWDHEDDSRTWFATDAADALVRLVAH